jgi:hypothetical protein
MIWQWQRVDLQLMDDFSDWGEGRLIGKRIIHSLILGEERGGWERSDGIS